MDPQHDAPPPARVLALAAGLSLFLLGLPLLMIRLGPSEPPATGPRSGVEPRVRVELVEARDELVVEVDAGWVLEPDVGEGFFTGETSSWTFRWAGGEDGGLVAKSGVASLGWPGATSVVVRSLGPPKGLPEPPFGLDGRRYRGRLEITPLPDRRLRAITSVGIEDYLAGVIGHEMPLRWSDTALHVQAIAARTYALTNLHPDKDHDLKSDTRSQVYKGLMEADSRAHSLVAATRGQVVTHQGELVVTYFHSTCGGETVPAPWIFDWVKEETLPLSGARDCACQESGRYRWELARDAAALTEAGLPVPLASATVDAWPRGGYVKTVTFVGRDGTGVEWTDWQARRKLKLHSYAFEVDVGDDGESITVRGRGFGHGVGMCQYGAEGFAKQGQDARWILGHFYPGTIVEELGY